MKKWILFAALVGSFYFIACDKHSTELNPDQTLTEAVKKASPTGELDFYKMPVTADYSTIPNQDPKNPITAAKVALGKMLFFETGIGLLPKNGVSKGTYSCSSCHIPAKSFTAGRFQGIADGAVGFGFYGEGRSKNNIYTGDMVDAQGARPLPVINLAYVTNALWAGSFGSFHVNAGTESVWHSDTLLEINFLALEGLEANNMRALQVHRQMMNRTIADTLGYKQMFDDAFPDFAEADRYSLKTTAFAIAAYFRTIFTNEAPFQEWLQGNTDAMSEQQKKGAALFFGKAGCYNCHSSPSLNNMKFFALGVNNLYQGPYQVFRTNASDKRNLGRGGFTGVASDMHKFKVPQLYNLKDIGFYFHGASKRSLREVVDYFNAGIPENSTVPSNLIAGNFHPLNLSEREVTDLVEFLENGLYDSYLSRYKPDFTMSGNCFPDNDLESQIDLGCK